MTEATTVECGGCSKPVNEKLAACPFCGFQLRARGDGNIARAKYQGDPEKLAEVAKFMAMDHSPRHQRIRNGPGASVQVRSSASALASAVWPAPEATPVMRAVDIALTIIALPMILGTVIAISLNVKRWGKMDFFDWMLGAIPGTLVTAMLLYFAGVPGFMVLNVIGIMLVAWTVRAVLRWYLYAKDFGKY